MFEIRYYWYRMSKRSLKIAVYVYAHNTKPGRKRRKPENFNKLILSSVREIIKTVIANNKSGSGN